MLVREALGWRRPLDGACESAGLDMADSSASACVPNVGTSARLEMRWRARVTADRVRLCCLFAQNNACQWHVSWSDGVKPLASPRQKWVLGDTRLVFGKWLALGKDDGNVLAELTPVAVRGLRSSSNGQGDFVQVVKNNNTTLRNSTRGIEGQGLNSRLGAHR